jgi:hypothetical protein
MVVPSGAPVRHGSPLVRGWERINLGGAMAGLDQPVDPTTHWQADHVGRYLATDGQDGHEWRPGVFDATARVADPDEKARSGR